MQAIDAIELMAVVAAAIYGILLAARSGMDLTGLFVVAFAAAFGGGTLRDLCLDRHPLFWIESPHYPVIVFVLSLLAAVFPKGVLALERHLSVPDALGTGLFAIAGAAIAKDLETSYFLAALFGVMTGTFGGVFAAIICNRVPATFQPGSPLNISCCFAGSCVFILLDEMPIDRTVAMAAGVAVSTVMRLLAVRFRWTLGPLNRFSLENPDGGDS